jgi:K+-transporting ATPase ATPase C chain
MKTNILISLKLLLSFTVITGVLYPVIMTVLAQLSYPHAAGGSIIIIDNQAVGSELIGQKFDSLNYFWGRPSAIDYQPLPSGGSNFGMTSLKLQELYQNRKNSFTLKNNLAEDIEIPAEMMYSSASGLDPHISVRAARLQLDRISAARRLSTSEFSHISQLVDQLTEGRQLGIFGEARINFLLLNIELDKTFHK